MGVVNSRVVRNFVTGLLDEGQESLGMSDSDRTGLKAWVSLFDRSYHESPGQKPESVWCPWKQCPSASSPNLKLPQQAD